MPTEVTFILGAGASIPAGIPDVRGFYRHFRDHLRLLPTAGPDLTQAFAAIEAAWRDQTGAELADLERLYELLTVLNALETPPAIPLGLPSGFPERSRAIELLHWELKKYVQQRCLSVRARDLVYLRPLTGFLGLSRPLAVVSLNYDSCIEMVLDEAGVSWTDGCPPAEQEFFASRLDFPAHAAVHLIKLHGSATWYQTKLETEPGWMRRARGPGQVGISRAFRAARTLTHEAMMIYPTLSKALTNGPFPALTRAAEQALATSRLCLAIGYSFADLHVRRLVLEALSANKGLRLVLVNPEPKEILRNLYLDAGPALYDRIGVASSRSKVHGRIETALARDWLLRRSQEWLRGAPIELPFAASRGKLGGPRTRLPSPWPWRLRYPVEGGVAGIARGDGVLYLARRSRQEICELDPKTGRLRTLASGFERLRGLTFDPQDQVLYAVSNKYRSWLRCVPWSRGGIGQLWAIDVATGSKRPLTRIHWLEAGLRLATSRLKGAKEGFWKQLAGALRWPTSVIVEEPGRSLLFTEARAVRRIEVRSRRLSTPIDLPLAFNVVGLAVETPSELLIADAGVHPSGFGRLLRANLADERIDFLAGGWRGIGALVYLPSRRLALLSQGGPWPRGCTFSVDLEAPTAPPRFTWQGLNRPAQFSVNAAEDEILISTEDGLVELRLD